MARIVSIDTDARNDVQSVTLRAADKKGGPSQILKRPITKLVLPVENEFYFPSDGAIVKWTKWELFCGELDVLVWYGLNVISFHGLTCTLITPLLYFDYFFFE